MNRRNFLMQAAATSLALSSGLTEGRAQGLSTFNIGFQKNGVLVVARNAKLIEKALEPKGIKVNWVEFQSGPPMMEAMNAGAIDFGTTGDTPAVFAQAANADVVYVAALPSKGRNSAILVQKTSVIRTLADLKGKKLAFTKGSSAHNVAVAALDKVGLSYADIEPVYLSPADANAAFSTNSIDAWSIWDPFYASAELNFGARVLAKGDDILGATNSFFLANGTFATAHGEVLKAAIGALVEAGHWASAHKEDVAEAMTAATGVPLRIQKLTAERGDFIVTSLTPEIVATQQAVADRFATLGLIPRKITVATRLWSAPQG